MRHKKTQSLASQFLAFASAGGIGTAAHYLLLLALVMGWAVNPVLASALGFLAGLLVNYLLSHHWVFRSRRRHLETAFKFLVIAGAGLALNTGLMQIAISMAGIHYLLAQVLATAVVLLWNFAGNRFWTFADETEESA
jgi:putative flippase GtrA